VSQPGKDVPFVVHLNAGGLPAGKEQTARLEVSWFAVQIDRVYGGQMI